jgi:hypothetical protein
MGKVQRTTREFSGEEIERENSLPAKNNSLNERSGMPPAVIVFFLLALLVDVPILLWCVLGEP